MYANSMLIILPNDMSRCWQGRAESKEGRKEGDGDEKKSKYLSHIESMHVFRHKTL